jgi:arylsulfatase A-like enzyme
MPTFLDVAGESPPDVAGRSLRPVLAGDPPPDWRDAVVAEYHGDEFGFYTQRMVRGERFKYVYNAFGRDELYDLDADPAELTNLVDHPEHRGTLSRLRRRLCAWMRETDDPVADWTCRVLDPGEAAE